MPKLKQIPSSRAKTAWGLLQDVKRAIRDEPKRADMNVFTQKRDQEDGGPQCGTVGCIAGWVSLLATGKRVNNEFPAIKLLGDDVEYQTVGDDCHHVFNAGFGDNCSTTKPGTRKHANAVIARINKFMRINAKVLKARKLRTRRHVQ